MKDTYVEPSSTLEIYEECDILVVGSGAAGHSAAIAAYADCHLFISKGVREGRTYTEVHPLSQQERVHELARIISGDRITELALAHAKEMLQLVGQ